MSLPVVIENDILQIEVWPAIGGKISSIIDKPDHFDLLFNYPAEIPVQQPQYDMPYANAWYAGWDECMPAVGASRYAGFPYDGIAVPDHGEIWGLPTVAVPTKNGITTVWHGLRFGYRLTRKLYLDGPSLIAEYTLVNLAPFEFRFVWTPNSLMSLKSDVEITLPESRLRWSHDGKGHKFDQEVDWPIVGAEGDLSRPRTLAAGKAWKLFGPKPITGPATVNYPARSRSLSIEYASDDNLPAYWGVWINTGGWAQHRHFALQPTTGRFDQLDRAIWDDSAGRAEASGKRVWQVRWTVS
jgi:hypothetical protein